MSNHAHAHAHPTAKTFLGVLMGLLVLTAITVAASRVNFGSPSTNVIIALAIATVKASLVALFFMHLRYDKPINALILLCGLLFLGVFLGLCFIDESTRDPLRPANLKVQPTATAAPAPGTAPAAAH